MGLSLSVLTGVAPVIEAASSAHRDGKARQRECRYDQNSGLKP